MAEEGGLVVGEEEGEGGGLLSLLIDPLASLLKTLGATEEDAEKYATWIVYAGISAIALIAGLKLYKFIRG